MFQQTSLLDNWTQENNELVNKCEQEGQDAVNRDHNRTDLKQCSLEFHKLLRKIRGIPPDVDCAQLELSVVYNLCVCFTAQSQFAEVELVLRQSTDRVLQMTGVHPGSSDPLVLWRTVLKSVGSTAFHHHVLYLLSLQWAIWLSNCHLKTIESFQPEETLKLLLKRVEDKRSCEAAFALLHHLLDKKYTTFLQELEEFSALQKTLSGGVGDHCGNLTNEKFPNVPKLVLDPGRLVELLKICTVISQGAERLNDGLSSEVLSDLQAASTLPAPRALVAYTHLLSGSCLAHMNSPQMALQCYRKALETDPRCVCALYQSTLIYSLLKNSQAEIQALRILHSILLLPSAADPAVPGSRLLSPLLFLSSQSLSSLLSVPSALTVLHSLALKCVLHGRVSEGVEYYLDLLAALHSEDQHKVRAEVCTEVSGLPKLPRLYLEAGSALLMAQRPADCLALCHEVISTTQELLPEKVVLEEPEERGLTESAEGVLAMLMWTAAAYLLQGHCYTHTKDWKQAVTHYTRCINLLVKVHYKKRGFQQQIPSLDTDVQERKDFCILQRLKGLSLAGRGVSFTQMERLKEALRDLQLSLQALPGGVGAGLWCGEVLWRLDRKQEAAACWQKTWSFSTQSSTETLPVYVQEPQSGPLLDSTELRHRIHELYPV